jgi:hypothetical protein
MYIYMSSWRSVSLLKHSEKFTCFLHATMSVMITNAMRHSVWVFVLREIIDYESRTPAARKLTRPGCACCQDVTFPSGLRLSVSKASGACPTRSASFRKKLTGLNYVSKHVAYWIKLRNFCRLSAVYTTICCFRYNQEGMFGFIYILFT